MSQPVEDGVAVYLAGIVGQQVAAQWDVTVACPPQGWLAGEVRGAGARQLDWEATREPGAGLLAELQSLSTIVTQVRPHVVHLHSSKAGLVGRLALRGRIPTVFSPHAWSFFHVTGWKGKAARRWEQFAVAWTDVVLCGSEGELLAGREAGIKARFAVIPNSSRIDDKGVTRAEARAALGIPPDRPVAICFGRYARQKGQDVLLSAWPRVGAAVPHAQLILVGSGPDEEGLRAMAPAGVQFSRAGDRLAVVRWILAADVLAFPSRWETLSLAVLEALELGRAVVVSDCQGMAEALAGGPGTMVPRERPDLLAEAIIPYLADTQMAAGTGQSAAHHYRAMHASQRTARFAEYSALLTALIAGQH